MHFAAIYKKNIAAVIIVVRAVKIVVWAETTNYYTYLNGKILLIRKPLKVKIVKIYVQ